MRSTKSQRSGFWLIEKRRSFSSGPAWGSPSTLSQQLPRSRDIPQDCLKAAKDTAYSGAELWQTLRGWNVVPSSFWQRSCTDHTLAEILLEHRHRGNSANLREYQAVQSHDCAQLFLRRLTKMRGMDRDPSALTQAFGKVPVTPASKLPASLSSSGAFRPGTRLRAFRSLQGPEFRASW